MTGPSSGAGTPHEVHGHTGGHRCSCGLTWPKNDAGYAAAMQHAFDNPPPPLVPSVAGGAEARADTLTHDLRQFAASVEHGMVDLNEDTEDRRRLVKLLYDAEAALASPVPPPTSEGDKWQQEMQRHHDALAALLRAAPSGVTP